MWDDDYGFDIDNYYSICGHKDFTNDSNYLGHLINDGAKHNSTARSENIYLKISYLKSNCMFQKSKYGLYVAVVSTKNIEPGEELFISYGIPYWRSHNKHGINN